MELFQSFLFVPADSERKLASARKHCPDAYFFDLEDAVAFDKKSEARKLLEQELLFNAQPTVKKFVRVNCYGTPFVQDDLRAVVSAGVFGIVLPKCNRVTHIAEIDDEITSLERGLGLAEGRIKLVLLLESALGVAHAERLAGASSRTMALMFGGEDFCADMGIARTSKGDEIAVARSLVALTAGAEGLQAIDGPFTDIKDADGLFEDTRRILQMGFTGKALIHPNQIETVHRAMAPSQDEIAFAQEVVTAFEQSSQGVITVRGKMIDEPVVLQARLILRRGARARNTPAESS